MAINKNHEFEELYGMKCAMVEKNASKERVEFLKQLLEFNKFTVIVVPSPPPKVAAPPPKPAAPPAPAETGNISTEPGTLLIAIGTEPVPQPQPDLSADLSSEALAKEEALAKVETFTI